jgi:hypothetical protein
MHTYVTIRPISAAMASSILFAATGGLHSHQYVLVPGVCEVVGVRNENGRCGSASLLDGVCYTGENGLAEVL